MPQVKIGTVTSVKMQKTVVVSVETRVKHRLYKKMITKTKNFKAHDELGVQVGQQVKITESKPFSKNVHFKTMEVVR